MVNNKIYVGVHKTKSLDDGYMGSGTILKSAKKKHGILNFEKVILEHFDDSKSMYAKEKEVVTEEFLLREDTYNLRRGGQGGFDYINKSGFGVDAARMSNGGQAIKLRFETDKEFREFMSVQYRKQAKRLHGEGKLHRYSLEDSKRGCILAQTDKARAKRIQSLEDIVHQQCEKNSQHGTMWLTNGFKNLKIKKTDVIPDGFRKGRVMKEVLIVLQNLNGPMSLN